MPWTTYKDKAPADVKEAAFMLIADDEDRDHANREKALSLGKQWREAGYYVISIFLAINCLMVSRSQV